MQRQQRESASRILIAEDNRLLRRRMAETLENAGYQVIEAENGEATYAAIDSGDFDLLLLDRGLGDHDGADILRKFRGQNARVPVVVVSSAMGVSPGDPEIEQECDDYITKPFYPEELTARVRRLLRREKT